MASDIEKELKEEEREIKSEKQERIEMQMEAPARPVRWDKIAKAGLLIIVVGALFLYIGYRYGKESAEQPTTPVTIEATVVSSPAASSTATADPTANWKTYSNDTYGFSFKYPNSLSVSVDKNYTSLDNKNAQTIEIKDGTNSLNIWINPDGFGLEGASDRYTANIDGGKINVTEKIQNKPSEDFPELTGQAVVGNMSHNNDSYTVAYSFDLKNRMTELSAFDKILSTFQFTK